MAASPGNPSELTCLLRWAEGHRGMELPVVRAARGAPTVTLLARTADEFLHRAMAEEDAASASAASGEGPVSKAAGAAGAAVYQHGAFAASGLPSLEAYLTRKALMYPDCCEALAAAHLAKGDLMSALITGEWYMRQGRFPGWGRPFEFNVTMLKAAGRSEEARDVARIALRMPWWSLQEGFTMVRDAAGMSGDAAAVRAALDEQDRMADGGVLEKTMHISNSKSERQVLMEEAEHLMNRAAAGECGWEAVRGGVAATYREAGLSDVANFVAAGA
jgi:hypothetical protein